MVLNSKYCWHGLITKKTEGEKVYVRPVACIIKAITIVIYDIGIVIFTQQILG